MNCFSTKNLLSYFILFTLISGCTVSSAPECDDDSVTSLVQEITLNTIKDDYAKYYSPYAGGMKYKVLKEAVENGSDFLAKNLAEVDKDTEAAEIEVSGIRTEVINQEIMKSECTCQLTIKRKNAITKQPSTQSASVNYIAQYSDDGQVYVEVFGL